MNTNHTDNSELLEFINSKCIKKTSIDYKKLFFLFSKSIKNSLITTYMEQKNIENSIICTDLIYNIFWVIYNYSNNAKLTMFMCDRALLLFNEYLNISSSYSNEELNITDVKTFIINKTIGPIKCSNSKSKSKSTQNNINIEEYCHQFRNILSRILQYSLHNKHFLDNPENFMESITNIISNIYIKLSIAGFSKYLNNEIEKLFQHPILPRNINLLKIQLELFYYIVIETNDYNKSKELVNQIMNNKIITTNTEKLDTFFDCSEKISELFSFQEIFGQYLHTK